MNVNFYNYSYFTYKGTILLYFLNHKDTMHIYGVCEMQPIPNINREVEIFFQHLPTNLPIILNYTWKKYLPTLSLNSYTHNYNTYYNNKNNNTFLYRDELSTYTYLNEKIVKC